MPHFRANGVIKDPKTPEAIHKFNMLMHNGLGDAADENNFKERYVKISCERINEIYQSAKKKVKAMENDTQKQRML